MKRSDRLMGVLKGLLGGLLLSASLAWAAPMNIEISGGVVAQPIDFSGLRSYSGELGAQIRALPPELIGDIPPDEFAQVPPSVISLLTPQQIWGLTSDQVAQMTGAQMTQLAPIQILTLRNKLTHEQFEALFGQLTRQQMVDYAVGLPPSDIANVPVRQLREFDVSVFARLSNQQFRALSVEQIAALTPAQASALNENQLYWSYTKLTDKRMKASFIANLNKESLALMIRFLPKSAYSDVFNSANTNALEGLLSTVNESDRRFILSRLNSLSILRVYGTLSPSDIRQLRPDQTFLKAQYDQERDQ